MHVVAGMLERKRCFWRCYLSWDHHNGRWRDLQGTNETLRAFFGCCWQPSPLILNHCIWASQLNNSLQKSVELWKKKKTCVWSHSVYTTNNCLMGFACLTQTQINWWGFYKCLYEWRLNEACKYPARNWPILWSSCQLMAPSPCLTVQSDKTCLYRVFKSVLPLLKLEHQKMCILRIALLGHIYAFLKELHKSSVSALAAQYRSSYWDNTLEDVSVHSQSSYIVIAKPNMEMLGKTDNTLYVYQIFDRFLSEPDSVHSCTYDPLTL